MSAFLVSKAHIDAMVLVGSKFLANVDRDRLGRMLWRENARSLEARYGDEQPACVEEYRAPRVPQAVTVDVPAALKMLDCYEYQSSEHDGWRTSAARDWCESLRKALIATLPGYDAAPWGVEDVASVVRGAGGSDAGTP